MIKWALILTSLCVLIFSCKNNSAKGDVDAMQAERIALLEQLRKNVQDNPDSAGARMRLINALDSMQMYREALVQTDTMILKDSLNNGLWFAKAQLQESSGDTSLAIESYRRAVAIYPSIEAQLSLANLYAEQKNDRAIMLCDNVLKMGLGRESDASCYFIKGVYYSRISDYNKALSLFDEAIKNNYTLMEAYMEKGFVYYDQKNYTDALNVFEKAVTINNLYADAYYWQAKCYEALNNKQDAVLNYQRSLGLDKNLDAARQALERLK